MRVAFMARMILSRAAALLLLTSLVACGGGILPGDGDGGASGSSGSSGGSLPPGTCPSVGLRLCPNDTPVQSTDVEQCNKAMADSKCGASYTSVLGCIESNVSCGPDGKIDSMKFSSVCKAQLDAYVRCASGR